MPEEKKKDSFTFSDKIKNSKPAAFKSFANRISSKIGSDGKPKKTLFERTKRDAPFFIAALVALLLLPFLYKYSGQVNEEPMITPGSEESIFDPERYGFDTVTGDPEGQIAQLAGRDPLSLIKGFGSDEEPADDSSLYDIDRSGLDDSSYTGTSVEENNTNIYRNTAAPATRAAFRRAATKINPLSNAGLTSRSGSKLGVGMWGGGLKTAAQRVAAEGPRNSPKPVSLQPLQAAGKPSRSYFGQGAAAEARRSKDAMSKANAMQALMDAQMRPIEPGKIGGLSGGSFGPGGGNGNLERRFAFNGKEPWWWDMMKRRSQMEWEARFNHKWDWIKFGVGLAQKFLDGFLSCIITGTDDWSMGKFLGAKAGAGSEAECAGLTKEDWKRSYPTIPFDKDNCRAYFRYGIEKDVQDPWKSGTSNEVSMGPVSQRLDCLSNGLGARLMAWWNRVAGKNVGTFPEVGDCYTFANNGVYYADFASTKDGWSVYHYVVGVPTSQLSAYYNLPPDEQESALVVGYIGKGVKFDSNITAFTLRSNFVPLFVESVAIKDKKIKKTELQEKSPTGYNYKGYWGLNKEGKAGAFKANTYDEAIAKCRAMKWPVRQDCLNAINEQATDVDKAKKMVALVDGGSLPTYKAFLDTLREGGIIRDAVKVGTRQNLGISTKKAKEGKDWVTGARCPFPLVRISCDYLANISNNKGEMKQSFPYAHLTFTNGMTGAEAYNAMKNRFFLSYTIQGENNTQPDAITTSTKTSEGGQWFYIPHQDVRPFQGAWSENITNAGFVTQSLGKERANLPGAGDDYQVVATSAEIEKLRNAGGRVMITWEVRQCDSLTTDGSSITKGGCNNGNIRALDAKGNPGAVLGQDKPGRVVSVASCYYSDNSEPIGFETDVEEDPEDPPADDPDPDPEPDPEPEGTITLELANKMNGDLGISFRFANERVDLLKFPTMSVFAKGGKRSYESALSTQACTAVGSTRKSGQGSAKMMNQKEVKKYVDSVIAEVNASKEFVDAKKKFVHSGTVTVPQLVDAMTIAYSRNPQAQVPLNVVCALGKTIGYNSYDPQMIQEKEVWRNTFGAFAAYTGPNSSYFPALFAVDADGKKIVDRRFLGCGSAQEVKGTTVYAKKEVVPYHYGRYNWNHKRVGDRARYSTYAGSTGRDAYLKQITAGGWAKDGFNPSTYPLHAIAEAVGFQQQMSATDEELENFSTNATIDDINRQNYVRAYSSIFNDSDTSCGLKGNMPVAEALQYVGAVCVNGKNAKPSNGNSSACGGQYKRSSATGTPGGQVAGETVTESVTIE